MICSNCSKELPSGSQFCPYCLHKFTEEKAITPESVGSNKKKNITVAVVAALLLVVVLTIAAVFFHSSNKEKDDSSAEPVTSNVVTTQEPETTEDPERFEERMVEEKPYVTDENGMTSYPPATAVVIIDESGKVKQGYILPE